MSNSRSATPSGTFDSKQASAFLLSLYQAEIAKAQPGKGGEIYKPTGGPAWSGGWGGASKGGILADGKDFISSLSSSYDKLEAAASKRKESSPTTGSPVIGASSKPGKKA